MIKRSIFLPAAVGVLLMAACGDSGDITEPSVPASIEVSQTEVALQAIGETHQLQVNSIRDRHGNEVTGVTVEWASANSTVATVDGSGLVEATGAGSTVVTATADTATAAVAITVAQVVADVAISPASSSIVAGDTVHLQATATDANGNPVASAAFTFTSSDTTVATVDGNGVVTGVGAGDALVTAASGGVSDQAAITVSDACAPRGTVTLGQTVTGTISGQDCEVSAGVFGEAWSLELAEDTVVVLDMTSPSLDPYLVVTNASGDAIASNDDSPTSTDSHLEVPLGAGTYTVLALDISGGAGDYSLAVAGGTTPTCVMTGSIVPGDTADAALDSTDCLLPNGARADLWKLNVAVDTMVQIDMRSAEVDAYLVLFDETGSTVLAENDDGGGGVNGTDAQIVTTLTAGAYLVMATTYGGGDRGAYTLATAGATACLEGAVAPGDTVSGTLEAGDCQMEVDDSYLEAWSLELSQQATLQIDMRSTELDAYLILSDSAATTALVEDDDSGGGANGTDARLELTLDAGRYLVWASTWPGESGAYELSVIEAAAAMAASVESADAAPARVGPDLEVRAPTDDATTTDPGTEGAKSSPLRLRPAELSVIRVPPYGG